MDWKSILATIAPWIGAAVGGPLGAAAVETASSALGLSTKTEETLKQALQGISPEQMLALKQADQQFQAKMQELGFTHAEHLEQFGFDDRKDARAREVAVKDRTPAHLAYMIIGGFFMVGIAQLIALMGWPEVAAKIPPQGWVIIGNISGYLAAEAKSAAAYFFGTTSESGRKTELLAQAQPVGTDK